MHLIGHNFVKTRLLLMPDCSESWLCWSPSTLKRQNHAKTLISPTFDSDKSCRTDVQKVAFLPFSRFCWHHQRCKAGVQMTIPGRNSLYLSSSTRFQHQFSEKYFLFRFLTLPKSVFFECTTTLSRVNFDRGGGGEKKSFFKILFRYSAQPSP